MTSTLPRPPRAPIGRRALAACLALAACAAFAQPTGNEAGSARPDVRGQAAKPPATRSPTAKDAPNDQQRAVPQPGGAATNPDNPAARSGHTRTPGSGTAGGLSGRHPQGGRGDGGETGATGRATEPAKSQSPAPAQRP
ncbi:hypothetical protein [Xenophilus sp. Marseille-Q4582]|uniref:hypothetical protein n=1 Tax=Xenophilus sp. Marseille-Q4582 TaxID=2866600 RepID=UPI001CE43D6C|nr:hypothetical protein [Xenophilus sp. Marseille-Q4582]